MTCILDDDEESEIEAEIQRELQALEDDSLHLEDVEDHLSSSETETTTIKEDYLPDTLQEYIKFLQSRTEGAEEEVKECAVILEKLPSDSFSHEDEALLAERIKEELGEEYEENPLILRDKVLLELEEEEELRRNRERLPRENINEKNGLALDIIRPGIIDEIHALEEAAQQQLQELENKQAAKEQRRNEWFQERKKEDEVRHTKENQARSQKQMQFEAAQKQLLKEQKAMQVKFEKEVKEEEERLQQMEVQFQAELIAIDEERKKENKAFIEALNKEAEYQQRRQEAAATNLQKFYRGFRARKQYQPQLEVRRLERIKRRKEELDAIERVERRLREDAERKKREEEQRRREESERRIKEDLEERKRLEEAERKRQLEKEQKIKVEEKRNDDEEQKKRALEEERKEHKEVMRRKEEEQKQREVEKRCLEEKRRKAEDDNRRRMKEEETLEEEQRINEWEGKMKLEERKRKEEEKRRRKEEEERRIKEEEEKRRKEEEERRRKEEEERRSKEEEEKRRKEEERRRKEEERRRKEEERRIKEEEEKRRKEEEEKRRNELNEKEMEEERTRNHGAEKVIEAEKRGNVEKKLEEIQSKKYKERKFNDGQQIEIENETKITQEVMLENESEQINPEKRRKEEKILTSENLKHCDRKIPQACGLGFPNSLEVRRQQWVKEHTLWSTMSTLEETQRFVAKTRPRRTFSASKHLPVLSEEQVLMSSPPNTPLHKVVVVFLKDLPSCGMQGFSRCPDLRSLTLHSCGVVAVEGLEQCKQLQELHVEGNHVEAINCRDLSKLEEINVQNNNLSSAHGLEGCSALRSLDLCHNKITRIGDLSSCWKLQRLLLDNNQLINTKGLSSLPYLQHLSLSHNHLPRISDIDKCVLLQSLDLQSNNLQEPPQLLSCVLLRELKLDDNSISSLDSMSKVWLPLLQVLSVSQNSLSQLAPLRNLVMLDTLDVSNNLISDTDGLISGLKQCGRLRTLAVAGNPVHEEPNCRTLILETLPSLGQLDGEVISDSKVVSGNPDPFIAMCQRHLQAQDAVTAQHQKEIRNFDIQTSDPELVVKRLSLKSQQNKEWFELAVQHLQEHENFSSDKFSFEAKKETCAIVRTNGGSNETSGAVTEEERGKDTQAKDNLNKHHAATKIQAVWRGWHLRHLIDINTSKWMAAVTIQAAWRGHRTRLKLKKESEEAKRNFAATVIQAHFRGQRVRRRLADALKAAQFYDGGEDFDYDEEVDLSAFDFDEGTLEQGWTPSETPQLPPRGPILKLPGQYLKNFSNDEFDRELLNASAVRKPRHAWRSLDSPVSHISEVPVAKATMDEDVRSVTSGKLSHVSHRAEELSSEWGFRNSDTAELMMKRARKMKYNPARRKKMLDPNKRLALFKKLEESNKLQNVKPPPNRNQPPKRVEYFAAREALANHLASTSPATELQTKEQLTYSWVYRQAVVHENEEKNLMSDQNEYQPKDRSKRTSPQKNSRAPVSLPHMDPVVLSGRTRSLVSSPFSHSAEEVLPEGASTRSHSFSSVRSTASEEQPQKAEKSNSAGARITRETRRKR